MSYVSAQLHEQSATLRRRRQNSVGDAVPYLRVSPPGKTTNGDAFVFAIMYGFSVNKQEISVGKREYILYGVLQQEEAILFSVPLKGDLHEAS
ncbi:hypothetical protein KSB_93940 [Ktedonobacter robiniae]|uniref:Uncharacterized protein n=1 Tax=Ktedonobacter robiniae TaxID=2778365 RepID=A0ABQ3V7D7_9CHLR|nr:hypothetical protein KSB_93940 [Ktedonobacter robiniae]